MGSLTREQLTGKKFEVPKEKVALPEFGEDAYVWIHGCTSREKNEHDAWLMKPKWDGVSPTKAKQQKERLLVRQIRDDDGNRVFQDEDIAVLLQWPADLSNRLFDIANRLCGGGTDTAKNSDTTGDE